MAHKINTGREKYWVVLTSNLLASAFTEATISEILLRSVLELARYEQRTTGTNLSLLHSKNSIFNSVAND